MHPTTRDPSAITDCYPELQYYAISQGSSESPREQSSQLMQLSTMQSQQQQQQQQRQLVETNDSNNMTSGTQQQQPRHLHPIPICRNSALISPHQLQEILPGSVFADHPSMGHYHYHIIPSRRTLPPEPMPRTISRLDQQQQNHHHQQQLDQQQQQQQSHYQTSRQQQAQPRTLLRPARSIDQFSNKDAGRPSSTSTLTTTTTTTSAYNNYDRYSQIHSRDTGSKKISSFGELVNKNSMPLVELQSDSQTTIASGKGKCQCHAIAQQHMRMKREASETGSSIVTDHHGSSIQERNSGVNGSASQQQQQPPALPPRPPPRPSGRRYEVTPPETSNERRHVGNGDGANACCKKYVVLCCLCGGLSAAVGSLFLAVHAVLSAHTASLALFETVPSYIPGTMLILIGLVTMLLARRKYRYGFLMKVCGSVSVVCALVCVLVTVTTTVVHMSRLQGLRQCLYTARAKSCTCFGPQQSPSTDAGVLFEGTPHCDAVHGALYACLRALFGVSVAGILACIFSCMLVYQLLSHEKKKMYWEQLELRCRSLYGQGPGGAGLVGARAAGTCGCCNDCGGIGPWWAQSPGNLYTPNPDLTPARRWRLPWTRSRGPAPSTDTNYGFNHHHPAGGTLAQAGGILASTTGVVHHHQQQQQHHHHNPQQHHQQQQQQHHQLGGSGNDSSAIVPYGILGHHPHHAIGQPASAYSMLQAQAGHHEDVYGQGSGSGPYSVLDSAVPLWGPPPPYSDPNSPARRPMMAFTTLDPRNRIGKRISDNVFEFSNVDYGRTSEIKRATSNYENAEQVTSDNNPADSADIMSANNISNAVSSTGVGAGNNNSGNNNNSDEQQRTTGSTAATTATTTTSIATMSTSHGLRGSSHKKSLKGVENAGFTLAQEPPSSGAVLPSSLTASKLQQQQQQQQTESELYFGDVSSCCGPESSLYDVATEKDGKNETEAGTSNHPSAQFPKRPSSSKRSRRHHQHHQSQLSPDHNTSSCSSSAASDEAVVAFSRHNDLTSAEVDYEVIRQQQQQQRRYDYEQRQQSSNQNVSVVSVESSPEATRDEGDGARGRESINDVEQRI